MVKKPRKLPKTIKYRGRYRDYIVGVEEVSRETLQELAGNSDGYWDDHRDLGVESELAGRILVAKDISLTDKYWVLWHERIHACLDLWRRDELEDEDG